MRLRLAESFEALKDTVKGTKNKITPDGTIDASPPGASMKHARSSDALNEPVVSSAAHKMRGSTSTSDLFGGNPAGDQTPPARRSVKAVESAGGGKSGGLSGQLFPRAQSASVPDMLAATPNRRPLSRLSSNDASNTIDPETSISSGGAPVTSLGRDRRSISPGGKRGRRVSYGIFFKPGFMRTSASVEPPTTDIRLCVEEEQEGDDDDDVAELDEEDEEEGGVASVAHATVPVIREPPSEKPTEALVIAASDSGSSTALPAPGAEDDNLESCTYADPHTTLMLFGPLTGSEQSIPSTVAATGIPEEPTNGMLESHSVDSLAPAPLALRLAPHLASLNSLTDSKASISSRLDSSASAPRRVDAAALGVGTFVTTPERCELLQEAVHPAVLVLLDVRREGWWLEEESDALTPPPLHFLPLSEITATPAVTLETSGVAEGGKPVVASGTLPALVQLLASEGATDSEYLLDFLTTYRYFAQALDVARLLIMRYIIISTPSGDQNASAAAPPAEAWAAFLQLKILNVFKKWIDAHPMDFLGPRGVAPGIVPPVRALLAAFLTHHVSRDEKRAPFATAMLKNLQEKLEGSTGTAPATHGGSPAVRTVAELALPRPLHHGSSEPNLAHGRRTSSSGPSGGGGARSGGAAGVTNAGATLSRTMSPLTLDTSLRSRATAGAQVSSLADVTGTPSPSNATFRASSAVTSAPPSDSTASATTSATSSEPPASPITAEFDPDTLAHQLTLLEHNTFKSIQPRELFHQAWNAADKHARSPHLTLLIAWFNRIAYGVATQVVSQQDFKTRVTLVKRFIHVAHMCYAWGNFNTVFEIVAGLNVGPVTRLKRTWKALPKKYWDVWNQLNAVVSSENSYKTYRTALRTLQAQHSSHPILPYLGVNLSDLTFAEDGNPTHLNPPASDSSNPGPAVAGPIINFSKFRLVSMLVRSVAQLQARGDYTFPPDPRVQTFLLCEWGVFDDAELYEASKIVEPRLPAQ
ncbi:Ras protein-specific guanine nucleotide-releasing factor [Geranomyces variabilis]|uniref:Ras protein-specific guanine nucleotide-releasing factor n=1 Tax=Geranomyces variabilis TaxID=109894 RepID=A0AAD5XPF3_9FUNG|nr:Ras protein-specific guanine nucleotide-releasing factor [Geranomyces variabilis]